MKALFEEHKINDLDIIIYDRDRAAINILKKVLLGANTILCI